MKKIIIVGVLLCWSVLQGMTAENIEWLTDLPAAQAKAKAENKLVLMNFTGSDWCGWCMRFKKKVYSTAEFAEYAAKNLILVELDFPDKKPQSEELKKANQALQSKYKVTEFPTTIILNGEGNKLKEINGYRFGGPGAFIAQLEKLKKS
jgi:thioredoxin-related protein